MLCSSFPALSVLSRGATDFFTSIVKWPILASDEISAMKKLTSLGLVALLLVGMVPAAQAKWIPNGYVAIGSYIKCWWKNATTGQQKGSEGWFGCPKP